MQGIDLTLEEGKQVLVNRIKKAAKKVCGSTDVRTPGSLRNARHNKVCYDEAVVKALDSLESRYLTATH